LKVTFSGKINALIPAQRKKLDAKLAKLAKLVDGRQEREIHFILTTERQRHRSEVTLHLRDHTLLGVASSAELLTALTSSIDQLEKQVRKHRTKRRDTQRGPEKSLRKRPLVAEPAESVTAGVKEPPPEPKVFPANKRANQKPLTLEEALLEVEDGRDYFVYRDSESGRLTVLLRRRDGNFDLVEST
jgi:putative sigma-54 modulation protein